MNGAKLENAGKYAIAGGNEEIIHLCEQNHSSFKDAYKTAIEFHRNDIFHYVYENNLEKLDVNNVKEIRDLGYLSENKILVINNLTYIGKICIQYYNFHIFMFLLDEGMQIDDLIINSYARNGNFYAVKFFLQNHKFPQNILVNSSISWNNELVEYMLKQEGIDINAKDIYLFYLIFILVI